jgi:chromosome segregation ATPase
VKEHFDSDISVLLQDKQRLQEDLATTRVSVQQLETELEAAKQQIIDIQNSADESQKIDFDRLTKECEGIKQARDDLQVLLNETSQERNMYKEKIQQTGSNHCFI